MLWRNMELKLLASRRGCKHPHVKSPACKSSLSGSLNACKNVAAVRRCRLRGSLKELVCHSAGTREGKLSWRSRGLCVGGGPWMAIITAGLSSAAGNSALSCDLFYSPTQSEKGRQNETEGMGLLMRMLMRVLMMWVKSSPGAQYFDTPCHMQGYRWDRLHLPAQARSAGQDQFPSTQGFCSSIASSWWELMVH